MVSETKNDETNPVDRIVMCGYWYCPTCEEEVDVSRVTFSERHDALCSTYVVWIEPDHNINDNGR